MELEERVAALEKEISRLRDPRSPVARMLSDVASKQTQTDQKITRILTQPPQQGKSQSVSVGFTLVDPHVEVFTDSGSGGSGAYGSFQTLDFGPYVGPSAAIAFCYVSIDAAVSGATDPITGIEWLPDGATDAVPFEYYDQHSLVDDAEIYPRLPWPMPLGASRSGQIRVKDSAGSWTYSIKLYGYL